MAEELKDLWKKLVCGSKDCDIFDCWWCLRRKKIINEDIKKVEELRNRFKGVDTELIEKALSIPVFYNSCMWDGNCSEVELVVIGHNPKLPSAEEVEDILTLTNDNCLEETYNFWNGIINASPSQNGNSQSDTKFPQKCLQKVSDIFKDFYLRNYLGLHNNGNDIIKAILNRIFIFDVSPLREVGSDKVSKIFPSIEEYNRKKIEEIKNKLTSVKEYYYVGKPAIETGNKLFGKAHEFVGQGGFNKFKKEFSNKVKEVLNDSQI